MTETRDTPCVALLCARRKSLPSAHTTAGYANQTSKRARTLNAAIFVSCECTSGDRLIGARRVASGASCERKTGTEICYVAHPKDHRIAP